MKIDAANMAALRRKPCLYAARSKRLPFIKFGHSAHLHDRLDSIDYQYPEYAPFIPVAACLADRSVETQLHTMFRPLRVPESREIYPAISGIVAMTQIIEDAEHLERVSRKDFADILGWSFRARRALEALQ